MFLGSEKGKTAHYITALNNNLTTACQKQSIWISQPEPTAAQQYVQCSALSFWDEKQSLYHIIKSPLDKRTDKCIKINTGKENKSA